MAIFDSRDKYQNIITSINELDPKFSEMNPILEKELYLIVLNLIGKNYDLIMYGSDVLDKIMNCLKSNPDFRGKNDPLPIHPLGSIPAYKPNPSEIEKLFSDSKTGMVDRMIGAIDTKFFKEEEQGIASEKIQKKEIDQERIKLDEERIKLDEERKKLDEERKKLEKHGGMMSSDLEFKEKYLKYKQKYKNLIKNKI